VGYRKAGFGENTPSFEADLGQVSGMGVSAAGDILFLANKIDSKVSGLNLTAGNVTIGGASIAPGRVGTLAANFDTDLNGLAINPNSGLVYSRCDGGVNKGLFNRGRRDEDGRGGKQCEHQYGRAVSPGPAGIPLLLPRSVAIDAKQSADHGLVLCE
jgi:hypothetical protein